MDNSARQRIVTLYEGDAWGDSIHPGGMELTERLAGIVHIGRGSRVLDVASGKGETALFLARRFGCRTVGIDLSMKMVARARQRAGGSDSDDLLTFLVAEAEKLPFSEQAFDAILCECSFSLLADKARATEEFYRVLRHEGRIGIADFYLRSGATAFRTGGPFLCVDGAETESTYRTLLGDVGFEAIRFEDQTERLKELLIDLILAFGSIDAFLERLPLTECRNSGAADACIEVKKALGEGTVGYCIVTGTKQ